MKSARLVSLEGQREISAAVAAAESQTAGQIVPMIVPCCGTYPRVAWVSATAVLLMGWAIDIIYPDLLSADQKLFAWIACFLLGFGLGQIPALQKRFIPKHEKFLRVLERSHLEFFHSQISKTRARTGILIFVSEFEQMAIVLADEGIHAKVSDGTWKSVVDALVKRIKEKQVSHAFSEAISRCGEILTEHFPIGKKDVNELPNRLIVKD